MPLKECLKGLVPTSARTSNVSSLLQHLNNLLENYLEPLKKETFLSNAEINALFGNIQDIVTFHRQFLKNLDEALELEPDFHKFEHPSQFKVSTPSTSNFLNSCSFLIKQTWSYLNP
jgi:hypothetical protein